MAPYFDKSKNDVFRVMDVHSYGRRIALVEAKLNGLNDEIAKGLLNHLRVKGYYSYFINSANFFYRGKIWLKFLQFF